MAGTVVHSGNIIQLFCHIHFHPLKAGDIATGKRWLASPQVNWGPFHHPANHGQQGNKIWQEEPKWQGGGKGETWSWR